MKYPDLGAFLSLCHERQYDIGCKHGRLDSIERCRQCMVEVGEELQALAERQMNDAEDARIELAQLRQAQRTEVVAPADPAAASTHGLIDAAADLIEHHGERDTAARMRHCKRVIPNVPIYRPVSPLAPSSAPSATVAIECRRSEGCQYRHNQCGEQGKCLAPLSATLPTPRHTGYEPDCADCPIPAECKAANRCTAMEKVRPTDGGGA